MKKQRQELEAERDRLGQDVAARDEELRQLQQRTRRSQQELRQLERNVLDLRSGDVVLSTGQPLTMAKVAIPDLSLRAKPLKMSCARPTRRPISGFSRGKA